MYSDPTASPFSVSLPSLILVRRFFVSVSMNCGGLGHVDGGDEVVGVEADAV